MNNRTITLYSTKGGKITLDTEVTTWGTLKPLVKKHYDLTNLQATENINKTTFTHNEAKLPDGDFIIFLRPIKTKGGIDNVNNLTFKQLRDLIKTYIKKDGDVFLKHINGGGNYTRLSTKVLKERLKTFNSSSNNENDNHVFSVSTIEEANVAYDAISKIIDNTDDEKIWKISKKAQSEINKIIDIVSNYIENNSDYQEDDLKSQYEELFPSSND